MIDKYPNFLMIPDNNETPEEIVEDYLDMIMSVDGDEEMIEDILRMFFEDANLWSIKQMFIDQAKTCLHHLEEIAECEHEMYEFDDED